MSKPRMKLLVSGANGQVGWELQRSLMPLGDVVALDRSRFDLANPQALIAVLDEIKPDVIVNAAAYTAVDKAEEEEALATRINGEAVAVMAHWAKIHNALVVHYSTDYVFDGSKTSAYQESDTVCPVNAYGRSKLAGEVALATSGVDYLCLRVSWVYASRGKNFVNTMLRFGAERETMRVVADQIGAPCWARNISDATAQLIALAQARRANGNFRYGIFHMVSQGETSWHGFAEEIFATARANGQTLAVKNVEAISASEYPTPAKRPANSRMNCDKLAEEWGIRLPDWRDALKMCLEE